MPTNNLTDLLATLTGRLKANSPEDQQKLDDLQNTLALALKHQNPATIRNQEFLFERSDLYRQSNLEAGNLTKIKEIAARTQKSDQQQDSQVFIRSVPVQSTQFAGGLPSAANGARTTTYGPFTDFNNRDIFIDVVKIQKLLSLYIQGQTSPAILFNATFTVPAITPIGTPPPEITKNYTLAPTTVWINCKVFNPLSTDGYYCGLRVTGGTITLNALPSYIAGKLTISSTTTATCNLNLEQKTGFPTDPTSPYGRDARDAQYTLPQNFAFSFTGPNKTISAVGASSWKIYGYSDNFTYTPNNQLCILNEFLSCMAIPLVSQSGKFQVMTCLSPFMKLAGTALLKSSWWGIAAAKIDITAPPEADGNGSIVIECDKGLSAVWKELDGGSVTLPHPFILGEPAHIGLTELASVGAGTFQHFEGWKDSVNPYGTSMDWRLKNNTTLLFNTTAAGAELISGFTDCDVNTDRPVKVNGEAVAVRSKSSNFIIWLTKAKNQVAVGDNNMLWDNKLPADQIPKVKPYALAMHNALFTVTPPNALTLFAVVSADLKVMTEGKMYLSFGLFSYLPTLPDPYAANIGILESQFEAGRDPATGVVIRDSVVWQWLIGLVQWKKQAAGYNVDVSFHFAALDAPLKIEKDKGTSLTTLGQSHAITQTGGTGMFGNMQASTNTPAVVGTGALASTQNPAAVVIGGAMGNQLQDFALLDVSSNANQMGVAFSQKSNFVQRLVATKYDISIADDTNATMYPILVDGMDVVTKGRLAQAFTVPQISWEPVFNLTAKAVNGDPPFGFNYYQTDGIATRIGNLGADDVPLSPIPLSQYLVNSYNSKKDGRTYAMFNLPFGMVGISMLNNNSAQTKKPDIEKVSPSFANAVIGGIQLELTAGASLGGVAEGPLFEGYTVQLYNINNADGTNAAASTLANSPTVIYNNEFFYNSSNLPARPAVPVGRIGLSGYGANMFTNWENKEALFAQTSQALFNVSMGRTSHEVVQVKSMVYPWGIRVVRTITLFRLANGYVMRIDSGWQAESDGKFDFSWNKPILDGGGNVIGKTPMPNPYEIHPGIVHGLFGIRNIREFPKAYIQGAAYLQALTFDADVELENITEGGKSNRVPSKGILGYVQLAPAGEPISVPDFKGLLAYENNTIGGSISCVMKVAGTNQRMHINRFDVNNSVDAANSPVFVAASRGSVILPKDGSWSLVQHNRGTGDVTPLPEQLSIPLIRAGKWVKDLVVPPGALNELQRFAHPGDLLKLPNADTINFGFLQNLNSQKVLFLTPSFKNGVQSLLSKTPPLMADSYRLLNSSGIFPNIDNAETAFGTAMQMLKGVGAGNTSVGDIFKKIPSVTDVGKEVFELMEVKAKEEAGKLVDQGFKLIKDKANAGLNDIIKFDLPSFEYPLVDIEDVLKSM